MDHPLPHLEADPLVLSSRIETEPGLVESLIQSVRAVGSNHLSVLEIEAVSVDPKVRLIWCESYHLTQFILHWADRPKVSSLTEIFTMELRRRKGLRAYGIRLPNRRTRVNQISSSAAQALLPQALAKAPAA